MHKVNVENIPSQLRERSQWVCWRLEERNGKTTKVPINAATGGYASVDKPSTWHSFDDAVHAYGQRDLSGIGYVFDAGDPYVGIDLDKCRDPETGNIEKWAREIIATFDCYTEISPSGSGVHIIVRGKLGGKGRRKGHIETYCDARYFTVTGNILHGSPESIEERGEAIEWLADTFLNGQESSKFESVKPEPEAALTLAEIAPAPMAKRLPGFPFF